MPSGEFRPTVKHLKIAFTYDSCSDWIARGYSPGQCAEFQDDETIESIAASLRKLGTVEMVGGVKSLAKRLVSSQPDWDLVFNFCEGYGTLGREAQVPALLEAWDIPFTFSDSATLALCMDKAKTKVSNYKERSAEFQIMRLTIVSLDGVGALWCTHGTLRLYPPSEFVARCGFLSLVRYWELSPLRCFGFLSLVCKASVSKHRHWH